MKYLFENEYKEWLISNKKLTRESAASYVSYMSSLFKSIKINVENIGSLISHFHSNGQLSSIDSILSNTLDTLYLDDICEIVDRPKNTINNWRSALLQYREFLYEITEICPEEKQVMDAETSDIEMQFSPEVSTTTVEELKKVRFRTYRYSAKDIMKNFSFRIVTQDRFFGEVFFPISYVKRLLCHNGHSDDFNKWLEDQIKGIEILCENESSHTLGEISEMKIRVSKEHSEVFVTVNSKDKTVYTTGAFNDETVPLRTRNLKGIAIDHINPMKNILSVNCQNLPQLKNITLELRKLAGEKAKFNDYKSAGSKLLELPFSGKVCLATLKEELNLLNSCTKLRLMDKIENIRKGAN